MARRRRIRRACCANSPPSRACWSTCIATKRDDPLSRHIETLAGRDPAPGPAGPGGRLAPDLDAFDGQLLCEQAAAADRRVGRGGDRQPPHQHHPAGPPRHLSEAARHDPRAGAAGGRRRRRLRPRLRDGPLVRPRLGRHAGSGAHGPARGADDGPGRHARTASRPSPATPARILGLEGYGIAPGCHADLVLLDAGRSRSKRSACAPRAAWCCGAARWSAKRRRPRRACTCRGGRPASISGWADKRAA